MEIDQALLQAVSVALTSGQGEWTQEELGDAYNQVAGDRLAGMLASMVEERQLALVVEDGEVKYASPPGAPAPVGDIVHPHRR
jgi:hypothetical protein